MTDRSRFAEYRDRRRGGPPRTLAPHGTVAADDEDAATDRMLDFILSDPDDPAYAHMYDDGDGDA